MTDDNIARLYAKARGSKGFLYWLCLFIVTWLIVSTVTGFDHDHGLINLILSAEASVSLAFFAMLSDKQDEQHREQVAMMFELLKSIKAEEDVILEEVSDERIP